ncbi:diguanylate cyclase [Hoeflea sp.]|uniref:diguanylate cyclase n=1 Tax=Hoeflea sp. TaxID=1940281 RepID=UPI0019CEC069|nr:diguanylate cyclase [Hoeflea sp.]MBC7282549.1 diguanylate cyclase [Hoeflea sp.]
MLSERMPVVRFEFSETEDPVQDLDHIGLTDAEIVELVSSRHAMGYWRSDLASGHVFWSRGVFDIYGMDYTKGPVNLTVAYGSVHQEDLHFMLELIERAASEKTGFHYVLRLKNGESGFKYVRSVGRYRKTGDGREELFGIVEDIIDQVRLVGIFGNPAAAA